jgi:hypothetical protein
VRQAAGALDVELNLFVQGMGATIADIDLSELSAQTGRSPEQLADLGHAPAADRAEPVARGEVLGLLQNAEPQWRPASAARCNTRAAVRS